MAVENPLCQTSSDLVVGSFIEAEKKNHHECATMLWSSETQNSVLMLYSGATVYWQRVQNMSNTKNIQS